MTSTPLLSSYSWYTKIAEQMFFSEGRKSAWALGLLSVLPSIAEIFLCTCEFFASHMSIKLYHQAIMNTNRHIVELDTQTFIVNANWSAVKIVFVFWFIASSKNHHNLSENIVPYASKVVVLSYAIMVDIVFIMSLSRS